MTEKNGTKISVYLENEAYERLSLLASLEQVSITALARDAIQGILTEHAEDIDFMREQVSKYRDKRRSKHDG